MNQADSGSRLARVGSTGLRRGFSSGGSAAGEDRVTDRKARSHHREKFVWILGGSSCFARVDEPAHLLGVSLVPAAPMLLHAPTRMQAQGSEILKHGCEA